MAAHSLRARFKETVSDAILDAAEQVASEAGLESASLQAIAQRAGVAVGTIYNHFQDRQELFAALFARRREELVDVLDVAMKSKANASFDAQLDTYVHTVFAHFDARRAFLRIALAADTPKKNLVPAKGEKGGKNPVVHLQKCAERIVRAGMKEKRLRADESELFAIFLVSIVRAVLVARVSTTMPFTDESAAVVRLFLQGTSR